MKYLWNRGRQSNSLLLFFQCDNCSAVLGCSISCFLCFLTFWSQVSFLGNACTHKLHSITLLHRNLLWNKVPARCNNSKVFAFVLFVLQVGAIPKSELCSNNSHKLLYNARARIKKLLVIMCQKQNLNPSRDKVTYWNFSRVKGVFTRSIVATIKMLLNYNTVIMQCNK